MKLLLSSRLTTCFACAISLLFAVLNTATPSATPVAESNLFQLVITSLLVSTTLILLPVFLKGCTSPESLRAWFQLPQITLRRCIIGVALFILLYSSTYILYIILNPTQLQSNVTFIRLLPKASIGSIFIIGFFMCIVVPLAEELLYRGVILRGFPPMIGLFLSTLFFALAHGINGYLYPILLMGWGFGLTALTTRSILPTFFLHATFNIVNFVTALCTL
jgi:membrane protease YdiL (CAAX protease family)